MPLKMKQAAPHCNTGSSTCNKILFYSLLKATTGSFFAALLDGIIPAISVRIILMHTSTTATDKGRYALSPAIPVTCCITLLIGMHQSTVTITPNTPEVKPIITVSALNMLDTLCFDAPIARSIPISFVRS